MDKPLKNKLNTEELRSSAVKKIRQELDDRLTILRRKNDNLMPHDDTNIIRGKVSLIKSMLKLLDDKPVT